MKSLYLKSDGNGGINISIPLAAIVAIMTILAIVIPVVVGYGSLNEKVANLEELRPTQTETIKNIEGRIINLEKIAAATEVSVEDTRNDISEIKEDMKYVLRCINSNPEG